MIATVHKVAVVNVRETGDYWCNDSGKRRYCLTIDNPSNDYDGFKSSPMMLAYNGIYYGKASWNSDKGYIIYTTLATESMARIIQ